MSNKKWTIRNAAIEWGVSTETISRGLRRQGIEIKTGKTYTTRQIDASIHVDGKEARAREANARAEMTTYELKELKGELFRREVVNSMIAKVGLYVSQAMLEMPHLLSQRVNPSDPELARIELDVWAQDFLVKLQGVVPTIEPDSTSDEEEETD